MYKIHIERSDDGLSPVAISYGIIALGLVAIALMAWVPIEVTGAIWFLALFLGLIYMGYQDSKDFSVRNQKAGMVLADFPVTNRFSGQDSGDFPVNNSGRSFKGASVAHVEGPYDENTIRFDDKTQILRRNDEENRV